MDCLANQMNAYVWWYLRMPGCNLITSSGAIRNKGYIMAQVLEVHPGRESPSGHCGPTNHRPVSNVQAFSGTNNVIVALESEHLGQVIPAPSQSRVETSRVSTSTRLPTPRAQTDDGPVTVTNNSFTVSLDAQSVTTS